MASRSPYRVREFTVEARGLTVERLPAALNVRLLSTNSDRIVFSGRYAVHGNTESDIRGMVERAGLRVVSIETHSVRREACADLSCAACRGARGPAFVDAWGLAGNGIILGAVQTGWTLAHRVSHGFGDDAVEANRHLLGERFEIETADAWTPMSGIGMVCGVPPCSGFSLLNTAAKIAAKRGGSAANFRGADSPINECQRELVRYAARCRGTDGKPGPEIVAFESVQGAFTQGLDLMRAYRNILVEDTGMPYRLTHLLHSDASLGGAQQRSRYFWVAHRVPFGVEVPELEHVTTYHDAISDLVGAKLQMEAQPYPRPTAPQYAAAMRRGELTGHQVTANENFRNVIAELCRFGWEPGESHEDIYRRYIAAHGDMPDGAHRWWNWEKDGPIGFMGPRRVQWDRSGYVVTGGGIVDFVHPEEDRLLTVREIARLMGVPDSWRVDYGRRPDYAAMHLGKNCPAEAGRWLGEWARAALEGRPGSVTSVGPRSTQVEHEWETIVDITNRWRPVLKRQLQEQEVAA